MALCSRTYLCKQGKQACSVDIHPATDLTLDTLSALQVGGGGMRGGLKDVRHASWDIVLVEK